MIIVTAYGNYNFKTTPEYVSWCTFRRSAEMSSLKCDVTPAENHCPLYLLKTGENLIHFYKVKS